MEEELTTVVKPFVSINLYKYKSSPTCLHVEMITQDRVHNAALKFHDGDLIQMEKDPLGAAVRYHAFIPIDDDVLHTYQTVNIRINYQYEDFTRFVELGHRADTVQQIEFDTVYKALVAFLKTPYEHDLSDETCATMHNHIHDMICDVYTRYKEPIHDDDLLKLWGQYRQLLKDVTEFTPEVMKNMYRLVCPVTNRNPYNPYIA